jgi:hypothetical protein
MPSFLHFIDRIGIILVAVMASLYSYIDWLQAGQSGFYFYTGQEIFLFLTESMPAPRLIQPLIKWVLGPVILGVKLPECEADHSPLVPRSRMMKLYVHYPLHLRCMLPNQLSTVTTVLFYWGNFGVMG